MFGKTNTTDSLVAQSNNLVGRVTGFVQELKANSTALENRDKEIEAEQQRLQEERNIAQAAKLETDNLTKGLEKLMSGEV